MKSNINYFKEYHFLIVDDEIDQIEILKMYLQTEFHNISQASSGEEALEILKKNRVDIILCDIHMPQITGLELQKKIKKIGYDLEFILISGFAGVKESREAIKNGISEIIDKPYTKEFVCGKIKNAIYRLASRRAQDQIIATLAKKLNYQSKIDFNNMTDQRRLVSLNAINSVLDFYELKHNEKYSKTIDFFDIPDLQKEIDEQHSYLFILVDKLREGIRNKIKPEMNMLAINELIEYTQSHFDFEEKLLEKANYPELQAHKNLHQNFTKEVIRFKEQELNNDSFASIKLIHLIKEWLLNHICVEDLKYKEYLPGIKV